MVSNLFKPPVNFHLLCGSRPVHAAERHCLPFISSANFASCFFPRYLSTIFDPLPLVDKKNSGVSAPVRCLTK